MGSDWRQREIGIRGSVFRGGPSHAMQCAIERKDYHVIIWCFQGVKSGRVCIWEDVQKVEQGDVISRRTFTGVFSLTPAPEESRRLTSVVHSGEAPIPKPPASSPLLAACILQLRTQQASIHRTIYFSFDLTRHTKSCCKYG
jgi:hypothetical protein